MRARPSDPGRGRRLGATGRPAADRRLLLLVGRSPAPRRGGGATSGDGAHHEQEQEARAHEEHEVGDEPRPGGGVDEGAAGHLGAAREPEPLLDGDRELVDARRQEREDDHAGEAAVQAPERALQEAIVPGVLADDVAHREEHERDREEAVHAEQRAVRVDGRRVEPLRVVEDDGRVDEEAEHARADGVQNATATKK